MTSPPQLVDYDVSSDWEHHELHSRVREAIRAVPAWFDSEIRIAGLPATDIFALNSILAAAIEERVVGTLNAMRPVWDPDEEYLDHSFVRQAQTFPDVLLRAPGCPPVLGIELKGWYLLAKEGQPSFRYQVTPQACAPADLFVVFPWRLTEVISGTPVLHQPFVRPARWVAEMRNYHWQNLMERKASSEIELSDVDAPYPEKTDRISDKPVSDSGGNFGRVARIGILDDFCAEANALPLSGIAARHWLRFLKAFKSRADQAAVDAALKQIKKNLENDSSFEDDQRDRILNQLLEISKFLG